MSDAPTEETKQILEWISADIRAGLLKIRCPGKEPRHETKLQDYVREDCLEIISRYIRNGLTLDLCEARVLDCVLRDTVNADRKPDWTTLGYITIDRFCSYTGLSGRTVQLTILRLLDKRLISRTDHVGIQAPKFAVLDAAVRHVEAELTASLTTEKDKVKS